LETAIVTSTSSKLSKLEDSLGHEFSSPKLLQQAVTHSSQAREIEAQLRIKFPELSDVVIHIEPAPAARAHPSPT